MRISRESGDNHLFEHVPDNHGSRDVLRRWAFPLVPDSGILSKVEYELRRGGVYVAKDGVTLAR